jgi:hypothetical protein
MYVGDRRPSLEQQHQAACQRVEKLRHEATEARLLAAAFPERLSIVRRSARIAGQGLLYLGARLLRYGRDERAACLATYDAFEQLVRLN